MGMTNGISVVVPQTPVLWCHPLRRVKKVILEPLMFFRDDSGKVASRERKETDIRSSQRERGTIPETCGAVPGRNYYNLGFQVSLHEPFGNKNSCRENHAKEFLGKSVFDFIHCDTTRIVLERFRKMEEKGESGPWLEVKFICRDGKEIDVEVASTPFTLDGKMAVQSIFRDVTKRRLAEQHLEFLANFDPLTGLPNRRLFFDRIGQSLLNAKRQEHLVGLLYLDLDRFKEVNDSLGHAIGDLLLKAVSERLAQALRLSDSVARMGGDEFTVILTKIVEPEDAAIVARRSVDSLTKPFLLEGHPVSIGVSIGIGIYPLDGDDPDTLLKKSDTAMYRAKGAGSNLFRFYTTNRRIAPRPYCRAYLKSGGRDMSFQARASFSSSTYCHVCSFSTVLTVTDGSR